MISPRRIAFVVLPLVVAGGSLSAGYAIKSQCLTHEWDGFQYRSSCYNDIYSLYTFRGLDEGKRPYLDGNGIDDGPDGDLEYPAGTGAAIWFASAVTDSGADFFRVTSILLATAGLLAVLALVALARDRWRVFLVAAGPPLILYSFHNWDLLAVAAMCGALVAWSTRRTSETGALLGFGAAMKVFPGVTLPAFLLAEGRFRGRIPWKMIGAAAGVFLVVNVPFAIVNLDGYLYPWRFQGARFPNFETHWYFLFRHLQGSFGSFWSDRYAAATGVASAALFIVALVWLLRDENRREVIRPIALSCAILIAWLLTAKVYSPQFSLWLLPFFALLRLPIRTYVAFVVTDAAVWAAISFYFLSDGATPSGELRLWLVELATYARYIALGWLLWHVRRCEEAVNAPTIAVVAG